MHQWTKYINSMKVLDLKMQVKQTEEKIPCIYSITLNQLTHNEVLICEITRLYIWEIARAY